MTEPRSTVTVPEDTVKMGPIETEAWHGIGGLFCMVAHDLGLQMAYSLFLSRLCCELRRHLGVAGAKQLLQGFVDTMEEAATGDAFGPPPVPPDTAQEPTP